MSTQKLFDILPEKNILRIEGEREAELKGITLDSRLAGPGIAFIAKKGSARDGHEFIDSAYAAGSRIFFVEYLLDRSWEDVVMVHYTRAEEFIGNLAHNFYGKPSSNLNLIGVTGTNGKSSVATLLHNLITSLGYKAGLFSTIKNTIGVKSSSATLTTPDPVTLNGVLAEMVTEGCDYAIMEVSSHAIDQGRIAGLEYDIAGFTNLTHDHLDYHGSFKEYLEAKKKFFDHLPEKAIAITNVDDRNGGVMLQNTSARKRSYGLTTPSDYKGKVLQNSLSGLHMDINGINVHFPLCGKFNAYNLLLVYAIAIELGMKSDEVLIALSSQGSVEGRFDVVKEDRLGVSAIVDYAHTPDALKNVLATIQEVKAPQAKIITVVGCGGDRDKTKRPIMAQIANRGSDTCILTSDNPRTEDPEEILDQMEEGIENIMQENVLRITDRKQAIKTACRLAQGQDVILIAGKGHEKYQDINGKKFPFDDKKVVADLLSAMTKD